eukprot:CAMPEP_0119079656 /NCGR_PEP_ID=MMETSP1178-20130426/108518_1 /TAXON_ID=33656 /ORGANISM="unid sp, Strain CCMP2000" /LENGTH=88 /DNA_ID=CAMNT_0007062191 /DNA_START=147 /DNA_END=413 /DNA_ORIENTATION=+
MALALVRPPRNPLRAPAREWRFVAVRQPSGTADSSATELPEHLFSPQTCSRRWPTVSETVRHQGAAGSPPSPIGSRSVRAALAAALAD